MFGRHMQIIYDINLFFLQSIEHQFPGERQLLQELSIIEESPFQQVRMAHLAIVGSHTVNGVAAIHSNLIKQTIFKPFVRCLGEDRFCNKTNGITPRRWLHQANPRLSALIAKHLGSQAWLTDLSLLKQLEPLATDPVFQAEWRAIKQANKERLAKTILDKCRLTVDPTALFDVQVKRIHEYKRQLMNILSVIHRYQLLKAGHKSTTPRVVIFGGKAAPGYHLAKMVIKLINSVADRVNQDAEVNHLLQVVFLPDYNVSLAEVIIPASDISQHISTAGTEASGTSNMKFVLNGGLILGTMDGANIEIGEETGMENMFIFGARAEQVEDLRHAQKYRPFKLDPKLEAVLQALREGQFGDYGDYATLVDTLTIGGDYYLLSHDFNSYLAAQEQIDGEYQQTVEWTRKSILSASRMGKFSSDRSIQEYAQQIWNISPCPLSKQ